MMRNVILTLTIVIVLLTSVIPVLAVSTAAGADLKAELARYDPAPAEKGKFMTVWIKIENVGAGKAEDAIFTLEPAYPFSFVDENDAVIQYGSIRANSDIELEYKLLVASDAPKGTLPLKLSYTYDAGTSKYEEEFDITVQDAPTDADLEVLFVETNPLAYPGATITLTADIVNVAPGDANYIIATVETDIAIIERNEVFVGTLEADDFDSMDIEMKIKSDTVPGEYPVKFTLRYKDEDFIEQTVEKTILMKIVTLKEGVEAQSSADPVTLIITIIILLVLIRAFAMKIIKWFFRPFVKKWQKKNNQ